MSDGSLIFDTKIDNKGAIEGLKETQKNAKEQIKQIESAINDSGKSIDNLKNKQSKVNEELSKTYAQMDAIKEKMRQAGSSEVIASNGGFVKSAGAMTDKELSAKLQEDSDYQKLISQIEKLETEGRSFAEQIRQAENIQESLNSQLNNANKELNQMSSLESQFNNELAKEDYLSRIQNIEQYNQELNETTNKLRVIEQIAQGVANENLTKGMEPQKVEELKNKLLESNKEYQSLKLKAEALNGTQSRFNSQVNKGNGFISKITSGLKNAHINANKTTKSAGDFSKNISSGIKKIVKLGLAVLSIRSAYSVLSQCTNAWMSSNDEAAKRISSNIDYMKFAIGSTMKPVLEGLVSILYRILGLVAGVIQSLFKVNIFANAGAKAYSNMAGSAKEAEQATSKIASFDNLDVLQDDSSSGGGSGVAMPDVDLSNINGNFDELASKIKSIFDKLFEPFKLAWDSQGKNVINSILNSFESIKKLLVDIGKSFKEIWTNGTVQQIIENILIGWTNIFDIIGNISDALDRAWNKNNNGTTILQDLADIFNDILKFANDIGDSLSNWTASESFQAAIEGIGSFIRDILDYLKQVADWLLEMYEQYVAPIVDMVLIYITDIINDLSQIWEVWKPIVENIIKNIENTLAPVIQWLSGLIQHIITIFKAIIDFITGVFTGDFTKCFEAIHTIVQSWIDYFKNTFEAAINFVLSIFTNMGNSIRNVFSVIKNYILNVLTSIGDFLKNTFGTIGSFVADAIGNAIKAVVNGMLEFVESKVNTFIGMINGAVGIINNIPGVSISQLSYIQLPRLAKGAVVNNPGRGVPAVVGEAGAEAILPLENNTGWMDKLSDKVVEKMSYIIANALSDIDININFDGSLAQFVRLLNIELQKENARKGSNMIKLGIM